MANDRTPSIAFVDPGRSLGAFTHVQPVPKFGLDDPLAIYPDGWPRSRATSSPTKKAVSSEAQHNAIFVATSLLDWFEHMHVTPRSFDFPNLLSDQSVAMVAYSAYRRASHTWLAIVNNAGVGVDFGGEPVLPTVIHAQQGFSFTLDVSTVGDPFVDATLDFEFTVGTIFVPISIRRIVLWSTAPEFEYTEELAFLSDVIPSESGKEKRARLRKNPRLLYAYDYLVEDDKRPKLENLLFDYQRRSFGVPVWRDDSTTTVAATAGQFTLTVDETAFRDYRVGGLAVILHPTDDTLFDVVELTVIASTVLTFAAALLNPYPVGSSVFPLLPSRLSRTIQGGRYRVGLTQMHLDFSALDNDANIGSVAGFSSYNGKVLFDGGNVALQPLVRETFDQDMVEVDGDVGLVEQESPWDRHKHGFLLTLRASGRQAIWQLRQVLYSLGGQQVSFYVPRDFDDLHVTANLASGSATMTVRNDGYAQFVRSRQPKNVLRVELLDGTKFMRAITNAVVSTPTVELLTLDAVWPSTIPFANVRRVDFVEKLRFDTDKFAVKYDDDRRLARVSAPVKAVFE